MLIVETVGRIRREHLVVEFDEMQGRLWRQPHHVGRGRQSDLRSPRSDRVDAEPVTLRCALRLDERSAEAAAGMDAQAGVVALHCDLAAYGAQVRAPVAEPGEAGASFVGQRRNELRNLADLGAVQPREHGVADRRRVLGRDGSGRLGAGV